MERYQTMRAYSAGGVVFRLVPMPSPVEGHSEEVVAPTGYHSNGAQANASIDETLSVEVVLVGRSHSGIWTLPKGTPQSGETIEQVAVREVQEETGLTVRLIAYVGSISYAFIHDQIRYQKQVRHYLFEVTGGDTALHDQEYDLVEWFTFPEASRRLTYQNEVNILYQAEHVLQRWLEYQRKEG
jgi:8-oxo-dGTP pyrophosphatase MutT (NUDIX family)